MLSASWTRGRSYPRRVWFSAIVFGLCHFGGAVSLAAQEVTGQSEPIIAGCLSIDPVCIQTKDGDVAGFSVDLARAIAERTGLDITFRFGQPNEVINWQISGEIQLVAGIPRLAILNPKNLSSSTVGSTRTRFFALRETVARYTADEPEGAVLTFIDGGPGSNYPDLLKTNTFVAGASHEMMAAHLLSGDADFAIAPETTMLKTLRKMRLDHRVVALGSPLGTEERVVWLHESHAGLLGTINSAIEDLQANGTLAAMRAKWLIDPPAPEPDVLSVGVYPFPPYQVVEADGSFTGFAVEAIRDLGDRAGLEMAFSEITLDEWRAGPGPGGYDLLPPTGVNEERSQRMDFTLPIQSSTVSIFTRAGEETGIRSLDDLARVTIGLRRGNIAESVVEQHGGLTTTTFETDDALLDALLSGDVTAVIFPTATFPELAAARDVTSKIVSIKPPVSVNTRAIALRPGLGSVRERLNALIPGYLISDEYDALNADWYGEPVFWTEGRKRLAALIGGCLFLALLLLLGTLQYRRRQRETRLLADVTRNLPHQVMLLDNRGTISLMNEEAILTRSEGGSTKGVGRNYDHFVRELIDQGDISIDGQSGDATFAQLSESAFKDGTTIEYQTGTGATMKRRATILSNGATLLLREDVTADRQSRNALQSERTRLQAVLDATQSGVIGFTPRGRVAIANPRARHMLGGTSRETPFEWPDAIHFVDAETLAPLDASADPIQRAIAGATLKNETALMSRSAGGDPRYVRLTSAQTGAKEQGEVATVVVMDDISELERNRQQAERSNRLDALGQLTGGIAHDFNNMLATIQYAVQLALQRTDDNKAQDYLDTALSSVTRGSELTTRLLAFAKRQPGLAKSAFVGSIIDEFARLAGPVIEETIDLDFSIESSDLWVHCDVAQLENALLNLVLNSRDAMKRGGKGNKITVNVRGVAEIDADVQLRRENPHSYIAKGLHEEHEAERAGPGGMAYRYIEFAVTDDGPGMGDEVRRRAIDPFFTTKDTNPGTGLGLSMVYGFVQQSNGELRIYSEIGHGTTVRLLLPRGTVLGEREAPLPRLPAPSGKGQRLFIVEDEPALLSVMRDIAESLNYDVVTATSGREALDVVKAGQSFDLLMTDIVMPGGIGGFELARAVREMRPDVPILYMSGYTGFSDEEMGEVIAPLLQKPYSPAELAEKINVMLSEK